MVQHKKYLVKYYISESEFVENSVSNLIRFLSILNTILIDGRYEYLRPDEDYDSYLMIVGESHLNNKEFKEVALFVSKMIAGCENFNPQKELEYYRKYKTHAKIVPILEKILSNTI